MNYAAREKARKYQRLCIKLRAEQCRLSKPAWFLTHERRQGIEFRRV